MTAASNPGHHFTFDYEDWMDAQIVEQRRGSKRVSLRTVLKNLKRRKRRL